MRLPKTLTAIIMSVVLYTNTSHESLKAASDMNASLPPTVTTVALLPETKTESQIDVLLSPGHGPFDGIVTNIGTRVDEFLEFEANYEVYIRLMKHLREDERFSVTGLKDLHGYNEEFAKKYKIKTPKLIANPDSLIWVYKYTPSTLIDKRKIRDANNEYKNRLNSTSRYANNFDIFLELHHDFTLSYLVNHIKEQGVKLTRKNRDKTIKSYLNTEYPYDGEGFHIILNPYSKNVTKHIELAKSISENMGIPITERIFTQQKYASLTQHGISFRVSFDILEQPNRKTLKQIIECNHLKAVDKLSENEKISYYDSVAESIYKGLLDYYNYAPLKGISVHPLPMQLMPNNTFINN